MELAKFGAQKVIESNRPINVCVGKEWHRFPSSFFLPDNRFFIDIIVQFKFICK